MIKFNPFKKKEVQKESNIELKIKEVFKDDNTHCNVAKKIIDFIKANNGRVNLRSIKIEFGNIENANLDDIINKLEKENIIEISYLAKKDEKGRETIKKFGEGESEKVVELNSKYR